MSDLFFRSAGFGSNGFSWHVALDVVATLRYRSIKLLKALILHRNLPTVKVRGLSRTPSGAVLHRLTAPEVRE